MPHQRHVKVPKLYNYVDEVRKVCNLNIIGRLEWLGNEPENGRS